MELYKTVGTVVLATAILLLTVVACGETSVSPTPTSESTLCRRPLPVCVGSPSKPGPIPAVVTTAFVALAIFGWTEKTVLLDPEHMPVPSWPWKLWLVVADGYFVDNGGIWQMLDPLRMLTALAWAAAASGANVAAPEVHGDAG